MRDSGHEVSGGGSKRLSSAVESALVALGRVLSTASVYGMAHPKSREMLGFAHEALDGSVPRGERLRLDMLQGRLLVNGQPVEKPSPMIRVLLVRMTGLRISGFSITGGMDASQLQRLLELLATGKAGEFERDLAAAGLPDVRAEKTEYRAVRPGEAPGGAAGRGAGGDRAARAHMQSGSDAAARSGDTESPGKAPGGTRVLDLGGESAGGWPRPQPEAPPPPQPMGGGVQEIIAFLKGEPAGASSAEEVARLLSEPERLAELILEASAVRQADPVIARGESMADLILGCLRRTYEGIKTAGLSSGAQEEPVAMRQALLLLEKNVLDRFRSIMQPSDPQTEAAIRAAIREMDETLELDTAAAQFVEHRAALARSERRIVEYLKRQGPEAVEPHLREAGLSMTEWRRLQIRTGAAGPGGGSAGGDSMPAGLGTLALILDRFDGLMRQEQREPEDVRTAMSEVKAGIEQSAERADVRLDALVPKVIEFQAQAAGRSGPARQIMEDLAEIAQELLQPLTVIHCSLQMMLDGFTGPLNGEQKDMLSLSASSGARMKDLMDRMIATVGYPSDPKIPGTDAGAR